MRRASVLTVTSDDVFWARRRSECSLFDCAVRGMRSYISYVTIACVRASVNLVRRHDYGAERRGGGVAAAVWTAHTLTSRLN